MSGQPKYPIRVLYIDHTAALSGGEIALANLLINIDRTLVTPLVLLFSEGPLQERLEGYAETFVLPLSPTICDAGKNTLGLRSLFKIFPASRVVRHIWRTASTIRELKIDLVHTNSLKADIIGGLAGRLAKVPVVWHIRDRIDSDYLPRIAALAFQTLTKIVPNFIIANSASTLETLRLRGKETNVAKRDSSSVQHNANCSVVHDGCSLPKTDDARSDNTTTKAVSLIGRISPWKGQHIFIEAVALLKVKHPTVRFEIVGAALFSEKLYEKELHSLCSKLKVTDSVKFVGFVDDIADYISSLDIVVHASTLREPFGQVIIEGMAHGKPVVATNGGGVPEIVDDGVTGLLVSMGSPAEMAVAIDYLLSNSFHAARMGVQGRARVKKHFTINSTARKIEAVYERVLSS